MIPFSLILLLFSCNFAYVSCSNDAPISLSTTHDALRSMFQTSMPTQASSNARLFKFLILKGNKIIYSTAEPTPILASSPTLSTRQLRAVPYSKTSPSSTQVSTSEERTVLAGNQSTSYCGYPGVGNPFNIPYHICSPAINKSKCVGAMFSFAFSCYWSDGKCLSVSTEDEFLSQKCNVFDSESSCWEILVGSEYCHWYEYDSVTPSSSPEPAQNQNSDLQNLPSTMAPSSPSSEKLDANGKTSLRDKVKEEEPIWRKYLLTICASAGVGSLLLLVCAYHAIRKSLGTPVYSNSTTTNNRIQNERIEVLDESKAHKGVSCTMNAEGNNDFQDILKLFEYNNKINEAKSSNEERV